MSRTRSRYYEENELAIVYVVLARLMKDAESTDAFKLGLIDKKYKVLRDPETDDEKFAMSPLWIFIFKIKRALGTRIISIFRYMYLKNFNEDEVINKLATLGSIKTRSEIKMMKRDMEKVTYKTLK